MILIEGEESTKQNRETIRRYVTRIKHNAYLFTGTIRENLLMGNVNATDAQLYQVLEKVNMKSFVETNGGLEMKLLEKASNLSGGQKQRIALARALLHDSKYYIFDEATSNIDAESEDDIMQVIRELAKTKGIILISHRLANVIDADTIYFLKDGQIMEKGLHKELLKLGGNYQCLFSKQMELESYRKRQQTNE